MIIEFKKACKIKEVMSTPTNELEVSLIAWEENAYSPQHSLHHCDIGSNHDETLKKAITISDREDDALEEEEPQHWKGEEVEIHEP